MKQKKEEIELLIVEEDIKEQEGKIKKFSLEYVLILILTIIVFIILIVMIMNKK